VEHDIQTGMMASVHHAAQQNAQLTTARFTLWIPRSLSDYDSGAGWTATATIRPASTRYRFLPRRSYVAPSLQNRNVASQPEWML